MKNNARHLNSYKILGKNIRNLREAKNISQEELAFSILSTRNYIGCIERAEKFPSLAMILDIAKALDCKLNDLFFNIL